MEWYVRTQGVEIYMLGEAGLGWFEQVTSGAFPSGLMTAWHEPELFGTSIDYYEACMKCS